ncbi:MAG TPA: hypothetical protein VGH94_11165 [Acidimicrobiales bacterium]|jgi:hypothetical protein
MPYPAAPVDATTFLTTASATTMGAAPVVAVEIGANERACTVHGRLFSDTETVSVNGIARIDPDSGVAILKSDSALLIVVLANNRIELLAPGAGDWFGSLRLEFCPL